jgi:hypothetical protein
MGQAASASFALTIADALAITTTGPLTVPLDQPANITLLAIGGTQPYTWSVANGTLPAGLTLSPAGAISGTATLPGSVTVTVAVRDSAQPPASVSVALTITATANLAVTTTSLPIAHESSSYNVTLAASGGAAPYTWSVASGQIPPGLALTANGLLTGKPTTTGTFAFKVTVTDTNQQSASAKLSCTVQPLAVTTAALPTATAGSPYTTTVSAAGGVPPYSWSVTGALPAGITFTPDGVLTGTPTIASAQPLTIVVTDQANNSTSTTLTLTVGIPPLPQLHIAGLPAQMSPATQAPLTITLPQAAPTTLTGTLTVQFAPDAAGRDDASLTFVPANSRTIPFTLATGATTARFTEVPTLQAGTSSGTITVTAEIDNTPSTTTSITTRIPQLEPVITAAHVVSRDQYDLTLEIDGYATTASVSSAHFSFAGLNQPDVTLDVTALFNSWYLSQPALNQGGNFKYTQAFTFTGDTAKLSSITITLTNSIGTTTPHTIPVT